MIFDIIISAAFYGDNDISNGQFYLSYCFEKQLFWALLGFSISNIVWNIFKVAPYQEGKSRTPFFSCKKRFKSTSRFPFSWAWERLCQSVNLYDKHFWRVLVPDSCSCASSLVFGKAGFPLIKNIFYLRKEPHSKLISFSESKSKTKAKLPGHFSWFCWRQQLFYI